MQRHEFHGFTLQYPTDWEIVPQEEAENDELVLMIQSPETTFWMLQIFEDAPPVEEVLATAADAICEEYENTDVYNVEVEINGEEHLGIDLEFVVFDLLCAASLRAFSLEKKTVLIYSQWADNEKEWGQDVLEKITTSLEFES